MLPEWWLSNSGQVAQWEPEYSTFFRKFTITLDSDIIEIIKHLAEEDDRSFSQYINMILKEYVKNHTPDKA